MLYNTPVNTLYAHLAIHLCVFKWDVDLWYWHRSSEVVTWSIIRKEEGECGVHLCSAKIYIQCAHVFLYPFVVNMKYFVVVFNKNYMRGSSIIGPYCTKKWCNFAKLGQLVQNSGRWTLVGTKIANLRKWLPGNLRVGWLMRGRRSNPPPGKYIDSAGHSEASWLGSDIHIYNLT